MYMDHPHLIRHMFTCALSLGLGIDFQFDQELCLSPWRAYMKLLILDRHSKLKPSLTLQKHPILA